MPSAVKSTAPGRDSSATAKPVIRVPPARFDSTRLAAGRRNVRTTALTVHQPGRLGELADRAGLLPCIYETRRARVRAGSARPPFRKATTGTRPSPHRRQNTPALPVPAGTTRAKARAPKESFLSPPSPPVAESVSPIDHRKDGDPDAGADQDHNSTLSAASASASTGIGCNESVRAKARLRPRSPALDRENTERFGGPATLG